MKRSIAVTLIFIAIVLVFPRPGSAQNIGSNHIEKKADNNKSQPNPLVPSVVQSDISQKAQNPGAGEASQDVEHRVRVDAPVMVNPVKDGWDKSLVVFTALIVAVGVFQIIYLWKTVQATSENAKAAASQARSAEASANAARDNASAALSTLQAIEHQTKALMNAERAWILIIDIGNPKSLYDPLEPTYIPGIVYKMKVVGHTPARIVNHGFRFHPVPKKAGTNPPEPNLPLIPDYRSQGRNPEIPEGGRVIAPEAIFTMSSILESNQIGMHEICKLRDEEIIMCAYGFIEYKDVFDRPGRTQFCYVYKFQWGGVITSPDGKVLNPPGFYLGGPDGYNKAT